MDAILLQQLKLTYGNVYEVMIKDMVFYVRELRRGEHQYIFDNYEDNREVVICQTATVYPEDYDFDVKGRAGIAANLADQIVYLSGLQNAAQYREMLELERQKMAIFENQAETFIKQAFHSITFDDMKNWTMEEFMKHLARAEWALREVWKLPVEFRPENEGEEGQEEVIEPIPPTMKEMGDELRQQGIDPMVYLQHEIRMENKKPFVEFPFIGGAKLLEKEEVLDDVREQIQRLPKR